MQKLALRAEQVREMLAHVRQHAPLESCGLLVGRKERVEKVLFVSNQAKSAVRFVMDPQEQLQAFEWIESNGLDLLGIFHSHPAGPETVSPTDIAEAAYEVVHIVCSCSGGEWKLRGFWITDGKAADVPLQIIG